MPNNPRRRHLEDQLAAAKERLQKWQYDKTLCAQHITAEEKLIADLTAKLEKARAITVTLTMSPEQLRHLWNLLGANQSVPKVLTTPGALHSASTTARAWAANPDLFMSIFRQLNELYWKL